jgi:arylsulfatase A-like enzyme
LRTNVLPAVALSLSLATACTPGGPPAGSPDPAGRPERPNVLFILVDDLRPELGAYGVERAVTPNIDRLASQGVLFERAYTQQAVCAPSRAVLLTGLRPDSTRIYDLNTPVRSVMPEHVTLPQHFRRHGYTTVALGKVYHHDDDDPQGWSVGPIEPEGEWRGRGHLSAEAIRAVEAYEAEHHDRSGRGPAYEAPAVPDTAYEDGKIANRAIEQMRRLRDQPFFLAVGFKKPHLPFNAPRKYWDLYPPEQIRLPDNYFKPEGVTPYSLANFGELRNYTVIPKQGPVSDEKARGLIRGYLAATSYVDAQIGRVLEELDRLGLAENTVAVLWGDHGFKLGEHAEWVKHTNFEIDTRVPLMVRSPGTTRAGGRSRAFVETVDIYPTLSELAGLPAPAHQGLSFAPLLWDPNRAWKRAAFSQYPRGGGVMGRGIRTDRYHYIEWQRGPTREVVAREIYDHQVDPQENRNLAGDPRLAPTVSELSRMLAPGGRAALPGGRAGRGPGHPISRLR